MSYDVYIEIDTGLEKHTVEEVGNMTSNVSGMWYRAIPWRKGMAFDRDLRPLGGIAGLHGVSCETALPIIREGLKYMESHQLEMIDMEPDNGWGSYDGALSYLRKVHDAAARHPRAEIFVSR